MFDSSLIALVFLLAGFSKGLIGLGLPTIAMALLSLLASPAEAAALLLLPSFVTNLVQIAPARAAWATARRLWPMLAGVVSQRTFLGETWDYVVTAQGSDLRLRATAPPLQIHEVGEPVWMAFDPQQIAMVI